MLRRMVHPAEESIVPDLSNLFLSYATTKIQIIIGKKSDGDLLEFKEVGEETQNLPLKKIIEIINKQKSSI